MTNTEKEYYKDEIKRSITQAIFDDDLEMMARLHRELTNMPLTGVLVKALDDALKAASDTQIIHAASFLHLEAMK